MHIESLNQKMMIVGVEEARRLTPAQLAGWSILSIRARMKEGPLNFPGARRTKSLHFDDVDGDYPTLSDSRLHFSKGCATIQSCQSKNRLSREFCLAFTFVPLFWEREYFSRTGLRSDR
jgi:hypothetical protein